MKDRASFLIALGIGIIISALLMNISFSLSSKLRIEAKAREMGMVYPEEVRVINPEGEDDND